MHEALIFHQKEMQINNTLYFEYILVKTVDHFCAFIHSRETGILNIFLISMFILCILGICPSLKDGMWIFFAEIRKNINFNKINALFNKILSLTV